MALTATELSTRYLPETDRDDLINEYFEKIALRFEIDRSISGPIAMDANSIALPGVSLTRGSLSQMTASRSSDMRSDGNSDIILSFVQYGMGLHEQSRHETFVRAGQAAFSSLDRPISIVTPEHSNEFLTIHISRQALAPFVTHIDDKMAARPNLERPGLRLLEGYAHSLFKETVVAPEVPGLAARHMVELAALMIGATSDGAHAASAGGVRAARLESAKAMVMASLDNPALDASLVAAHLGVSRRYLDMLFEAERYSLGTFITEQRLARASTALTDPTQRRRIIDIALEAGFSDVGTFNRAFRKRFGHTPSDARRAAERDGVELP
jgi:AraC-like DNA-binding protein